MRNIASEALIEIADMWKVDHARVIETEHGFDWWPEDFRVSVSAIPRTDGHMPETWMLSVRTDFLKDIPINSDRFVRRASLLSVWDHYRTAGDTPQLWLANTAYLTAESAFWLPRFLSHMSIMQPISAQLATDMPELVGGVLNVSSPRLLGPSAQQDVLGETLAAYVSRGSAPSRWIGNSGFETIAANWSALDRCICSGDGEGI